MYPGLTVPLVGLLALGALALAWPAVRLPVVRRLAMRQIARRRTEGLLVMAGASLGAAIIVGSLIVGDTLGFSVRQVAYRTLGNVDERVVSTDAAIADRVAVRMQSLAHSPEVDGVLTARVQQAAATAGSGAATVAEPRVLAWDVDFAMAHRFGAAAGPSACRVHLLGPARLWSTQPSPTRSPCRPAHLSRSTYPELRGSSAWHGSLRSVDWAGPVSAPPRTATSSCRREP